ncbi:Putative ribonuclease H protein At1g65750 [Linum perenne]
MVFKEKYFPKGSFLTAKEGSNPSLVWKSIWSSQVTTPMITDLEELKFAYLLIPGLLEWDEEHVYSLFNDKDAAIILSMPLPRSLGSDYLIWHFDKLGRYSVRSAYRAYMERVVRREHLVIVGNWTAIWRTHLLPKVKHFIWCLGRGVLFTKESLHQRGIHVSGECGCCGNTYEIACHLFLTCSFAQECWNAAGRKQLVKSTMVGKTSVAEWVLGLIEGNPEDVVQDIMVILWSAWNERNNRVWSNKEAKVEWVI